MPTRIDFNSTAVRRKLKRINREYRPEFQKVIQTMLDEIRFESVRWIIPNSTGFLNPKMARKRQPSTAGKLTSRTGKLVYMLKHKSKPHGEGFSGSRSKIKRSAGMEEKVLLQRKGSKLESYRGKAFYKFSSHGRLMSTGSKEPVFVNGRATFPKIMPKENSQTLFFRFLHDRQSVRGGGKRPFLTPSARANKTDMVSLAAKRLDELLSRL